MSASIVNMYDRFVMKVWTIGHLICDWKFKFHMIKMEYSIGNYRLANTVYCQKIVLISEMTSWYGRLSETALAFIYRAFELMDWCV